MSHSNSLRAGRYGWRLGALAAVACLSSQPILKE